MMVIDHVRADRQTEFEQLLGKLQASLALGAKKDADIQRAIAAMRVLRPSRPSADGSQPYVFVFDPIVEGTSYSLEPGFGHAHGSDAKTLTTALLNCLQKPQEIIRVR